MPAKVANHSLQSTRYWVGRHLIPKMETSHLLNTLRFLLRNPLGQLGQSEIRHQWECAEAEEHGDVDWDLPGGGSAVLRDYSARCRYDRQLETLTETSSEAASIFEDAVPPPPARTLLRIRADQWIRETPTFTAMSNELMTRLLNGHPIPPSDDLDPDDDNIIDFVEPF